MHMIRRQNGDTQLWNDASATPWPGSRLLIKVVSDMPLGSKGQCSLKCEAINKACILIVPLFTWEKMACHQPCTFRTMPQIALCHQTRRLWADLKARAEPSSCSLVRAKMFPKQLGMDGRWVLEPIHHWIKASTTPDMTLSDSRCH